MSAGATYGALIANWNGSEFIERCLGSVLAAARRAGVPMRIMVTDDASSDDSPGMIARRFPGVELLRWTDNVGFGAAVNRGVEALDTPWIFLLNNDLALPADYFERLIAAHRAHDGPDLFAIGAKTLQWETHEANHGGMNAAWRNGMIVQEPFEADELVPAAFVQGGSCLVSRDRYLELGGFCHLFHPGYWEDYDLCYQALRRGWRILYEPRAAAFHWGKKSMAARLGRERLWRTIRRNHLIFNWINLHDGGLTARHLAGLGAWLRRNEESAEAAGWIEGPALLAALRMLPAALRERRRRIGAAKAGPGDRKVLGVK